MATTIKTTTPTGARSEQLVLAETTTSKSCFHVSTDKRNAVSGDTGVPLVKEDNNASPILQKALQRFLQQKFLSDDDDDSSIGCAGPEEYLDLLFGSEEEGDDLIDNDDDDLHGACFDSASCNDSITLRQNRLSTRTSLQNPLVILATINKNDGQEQEIQHNEEAASSTDESRIGQFLIGQDLVIPVKFE